VLSQHLNSVIRIPPTHPTMQPATRVAPAYVGATETTIRCPPFAHLPQPGQCIAPLHIDVGHVLSLFPGEMKLSAPPLTSPHHDWMANADAESFIGALCVSWVFYRDAQKRNDRGDTSYHPQFFARVSGPNQDTFIMRMTSEWFAAARKYTDSPSLGRCVNHVRGPRVQRTLQEQVHIIPFTPKHWEFEVLTKLVVVG
jgi:hypothetical protein